MTTDPRREVEGWINPHDKTQKQWLPWIKERVFIRFKSGDVREGWHNGGSWRCYSIPVKQFSNEDVEAWAYPRSLSPAERKEGEK
jgi:hypothetical protein